MTLEQKFTARIRLICDFLDRGGGTLLEMLDSVNQGLEKEGLEKIELRTLQTSIYRLRKGNFIHSRRDDPPEIRGGLFKIRVEGQKRYCWGPNTKYPQFGDLDQEERFTLPFLAGILEKYQSIPAVQRVIQQLPVIFNLNDEEMKSSSAVIHSGPDLYFEPDAGFQDKVIGCVIKILYHLHKGECIEFSYWRVNKGIEYTLQQVAPLQIRFFENYYYLIATSPVGRGVFSLRVDQIHRFKIDVFRDEAGKAVTFDHQQYLADLKVSDHFKNSLGVWVNKYWKVYEVEIEFKGWAASYIKHLRFHASQRVVREDQENALIVVSFQLSLSEQEYPNQPLVERSSELGFFLGRFRESAIVIAHRPL